MCQQPLNTLQRNNSSRGPEGENKLKAPKIASNNEAIPVSAKTDILAKSIAIFQNANLEVIVVVFTVPKGAKAEAVPIMESTEVKMKTKAKEKKWFCKNYSGYLS